MKLIIETSKYNKEWIGNLHFIPEELRFEIGNAIIDAIPFDSVLEDIKAEIQTLRNCSCSCSDGIIDDVEDIIDKHKT